LRGLPEVAYVRVAADTAARNPNGGNMKYTLLALTLLFAACDKPPTPKIAAPQREALDKAKALEQAMQKETEEAKQKIEDAEK
jgi:hypothetical protein